MGWLIYTESIDVYTAVGAALILAGNLLNLKGSGGVRSRPASRGLPPA
ncbi:MAG: hypothetical protein H0T52_09825 [Lautropia sp.]|nr:hypothetical protein [Lautropia sp.]